VFVIEYIGPVLIHLAFASPLVRKTIYRTSEATPLSPSQYLSMAMIVIHFLKREYETLYVHKFSLSTMPLRNIFKNSAHYWILSGINIAYFIYKPTSYTFLSSPAVTYINIIGVILYIFGEVSNFFAHQSLSSLRTRGGTERGIPKGFGFDLVTCPNYLFEVIAWTGILLVTKSWTTLVFDIAAWAQMHQWAIKKEKALRAEFPDKYKKKKYVLLPSPGAVIKYLTG
jgi:very-long-chain enoyl-CoA reductase